MTDYSQLTLDQLENMSDEEFAKIDVSQIQDPQPAEEPQHVEHQSVEEPVIENEEVAQETETPADTNQPNKIGRAHV